MKPVRTTRHFEVKHEGHTVVVAVTTSEDGMPILVTFDGQQHVAELVERVAMLLMDARHGRSETTRVCLEHGYFTMPKGKLIECPTCNPGDAEAALAEKDESPF